MKLKLIAAGLCLAACTTSAQAVVVVDQNYTSAAVTNAWFTASNPDWGFRRAQTFTVGVTGVLNSIDVFLYAGLGGFGGMHILDSIAGTGNIVGTTTSFSNQGATYRFDVRSLGIAVEAGQVMAFEAFGDVMQLEASVDEPGYAGGGDWFINPEFGFNTFSPAIGDVRFVTTVDNLLPVPEPAHYAMLLAGLGVLAARARRRSLRE